MMKHVTKGVIFTVTVLVSYLLTGLVEDKIMSQTEQFRPVTATLLGMGTIVLIFVPLFAYVEKITEAIVKASLRTTRTSAGKVIGVLLFIGTVFLVLFAIFLKRWYHLGLGDVL